MARHAFYGTSVSFGHTAKTKDEGQVVLIRQKMGLPVKIILSCVIASTALCFIFETSQKHLPMALICT